MSGWRSAGSQQHKKEISAGGCGDNVAAWPQADRSVTKLFEELIRKAPVLTDGAWGTELQIRGLRTGELPDAWNLANPERVHEVARAYADAGSWIILTNTFRSNHVALARHGLAGRVAQINRAGVEISLRAAGKSALVFAAMGPTGKHLASGDITPTEVDRAFVEQASALARAGAHGIVIETMSDLAEAKLAVEAAKKTGLSVVVCMVFDSGRNKDRTKTGATPEEAARELTEAGADAVGANCGHGIAAYVSICQRLRSATDLPIWIKPNAGLPLLVEGRAVYATSPGEFAGHVPELVAAGATFIGGCCGTTPGFIRALSGCVSRGSSV